jgi:hypothetical protein
MMNFLKSYFKINIEKYKKKIFFTFLWISCFFSININPEDFYKLNLIQILKLTIPSLLIISFFIYNFKNKLKYFLNDKLFIFCAFIAYIILGSFSIFLNPYVNSYLNIYWGILMFFPFLYIYSFKNNSDQLDLFLILSLLIIFFVFIYFFSIIIYLMILKKEIIHLYGISAPNLNYSNNGENINPRSSGLSRMSIIIYISLVIYLINNQKKIYFNKLIFSLAIIFGSIGLMFQSRTMNFIFFIFIILLILIYFKKKLVNKNYIFLLIFVPVILAGNYIYFISHKKIAPENFKDYKDDQTFQNKLNLFIENNQIKKIVLREKNTNFSSNRFNIWHKVIDEGKKNNFFGYGFQADRKIINESAHNVYIYALICGGILSVILIILISLRSAWISFLIIFNYIFLNKKYSITNIISAFLMILFLQRGLLETSYGIYSIDYLFFIICFFINELNYRKNILR